MRVLGVDPGLSRCGLGVVDGSAGSVTPVRLGVVRTSADAPTGDRLAELYEEIDGLLTDAAVEAVAVERTFFGTNVRTAMAVGQAGGIVLLAAARRGVPLAEYTPTQVKAAVAGHGSAGKPEMAAMVRARLGLGEPPRPADAADALGLALCHLHHVDAPTGEGMSPRLAAAVEAAEPGAQVARPGGARTGPRRREGDR